MATESTQSENANAGVTSAPSSETGGWATRNRLIVTIIVGVGLIVTVVTLKLTAPPEDEDELAQNRVTLDKALTTLDNGEYGRARDMAMQLHYQAGPEQRGGPAFILGAAAAYEAEELWGKDKLTQHARAATHLEEASDRGFPESRQAEGLLLLGRSLFRSNQVAASRPVLEHATQLGKDAYDLDDWLEILRLLTDAHLDNKTSGATRALELSQQFLGIEELAPNDRDEGLLRHARILFELGETERCRNSLDQLPPKASNLAQAMVVRGRLLLREAEQLAKPGAQQDETQANATYERAKAIFASVHEQYSAGEAARSQAHYLTATCLIRQGKTKEAVNELRKVHGLSSNSGEGIVATITEANLLRDMGQDDIAIRRYRETVKSVVAVGSINNDWIGLSEIRQHLFDSVAHYIAIGKFEAAVQVADLMAPLTRASRSIQLTAQSQVAWARDLDSEAEAAPRSGQAAIRHEARKHYREAGQIYRRLARIRYSTRDYPDDLWESAENFRRGHDFANAIKMYEEYLKNESRQRIPDALVGLGESHLAIGNFDQAIDALTTCIEDHPLNPSNYRSRILAAEAHREKGNLEAAETFLRSNITDPHLTPQSHEWEVSLFALGRLLHTDNRHAEAIDKLVEAVRRYPDSPHSMEAQYLIAESYRKAAREPLELLKKATIETSRQQHIRELRQLLVESESYYERVRQDLNLRPDTVSLTEVESAILRNCYFALGAVYFAQGGLDDEYYEQAIVAYSDASNLYQSTPEALEAFVQMAACHRRLDRPMQARRTLERAKLALKELDEDIDYEQTTNFTRHEWEKYLSDLIEFSK